MLSMDCRRKYPRLLGRRPSANSTTHQALVSELGFLSYIMNAINLMAVHLMRKRLAAKVADMMCVWMRVDICVLERLVA